MTTDEDVIAKIKRQLDHAEASVRNAAKMVAGLESKVSNANDLLAAAEDAAQEGSDADLVG